MSVKKLLILAAAGVGLVSTAALAGGAPAGAYSSPAHSDFNVGPYAQLNIGYAYYGWKHALGTDAGGSWSRGNWGFTPGLAVGYSFNNYLAAELGGFYIWPAKYSENGANLKIKQWMSYAAGRISIPVYQDTTLYTKVGIGYQHVKVDDSLLSSRTASTEHSWEPFFGLGVNYSFTPQIYAGLEWDFFAGDTRNSNLETRDVSILMATVGYKFAM